MDTLTVDVTKASERIDRNIYGHFAEHLGRCIYEGFWVGEDSDIPNTRGIRNDVVQALRALNLPVLRWPGGCFADEYHWMDGIGPRDQRAAMVNTHWGGETESNHFGTHEFFDLCEMLGAKPYICGNVGSGSVREMSQWVEYCCLHGKSPWSDLRRANGRDQPWDLSFFGVGNESWGCGGNMTAEHYADEYRRYQTYVRQYGENRIFKIACGANSEDYEWTEVLMRRAGALMDGLSLHYYTVVNDSGANSSATQFGEPQYFSALKNCLKIDELITRHAAVMDKYDPEKRVAMIVDEWGTWWSVEPGTKREFLYQQNTMRDAMVAGLSLNIFNANCDRVRMANIAQTVNVLQAMILTNGPRIITTPTYHVFEMWKVHQGATLLGSELCCGQYSLSGETLPTMSASASIGDKGIISITLCRTDPARAATVRIAIPGGQIESAVGRVLAGSAVNARNTFDDTDAVRPRALSREEIGIHGTDLTVTLPPASLAVVKIETQ